MTTTLPTSNFRGGPSRLTRINPARSSKSSGFAALRQNSLTSNSGRPLASFGVSAPIRDDSSPDEPPGLYPAISHFADAIAALPRDFRRHVSLLKEVDAKGWGPEENLQKILEQCLIDTAMGTKSLVPATQSLTGSVTADESVNVSEVNSVTGASLDNASLTSGRSADPAVVERRQRFHALRQNLIAVMMTMDEKNHVINNANEEVSRHIRRLDKIFPHIDDEISEEARLGSLKHWAYTETNPVKKSTAPATRRDAAASLAILHESEVAHRSEARREAIMARRQRATQHVDSDFDESRNPPRRTAIGKKRVVEPAPDPAGLGITGAGPGKRKKSDKPALGGVSMERSVSGALGGRPMSRENSQQDHAKKRKASAAMTTVARKRINASTQDSPKLVSSPLAGNAGKEAYIKSPALSTVRPAAGRGRQNSTQTVDSARGRPSSLISNRNGNNNNAVAASTPELNSVATASGKSTSEAKATMKETKTDKGDRLVEDEPDAVNGSNSEHQLRGALLLERSSSRQETARGEPAEEVASKGVASPRLPLSLQTSELRSERSGRGRASKTSTPVTGTFAEAEAAETGSTNGNGNGSKTKRVARPRVKDHGLHDSLSPKGLPMKRSHKKGGSISTLQLPTTQRLKEESDTTKSNTPSERDVGNNDAEDEDDEENDAAEEDEERYCYCQGVSYGEMVACDKPDCPRQWFHLECIGLKSVPKSAKWYCDECKEALAKKGKVAGNGGNGNGK
ncbi:uncharacterized protein Z518_06068 [Rhinocladiella mackenziei CBS 650.93]|uniref:Chromatin modification-related protein n=1 Tax=Rhinocladiella mackenziei CBS 650.93 TaxID=1442369 RepID=A0A0D2IPT5_9EURO|nr:uncharacterized protein Z518_06068 [Rhinocladiella mackenziei CBS 650.93]KIX05196.1 hypothetical protein Z518_06068 [Rhinocladiella mackenziei CBS 650.93]